MADHAFSRRRRDRPAPAAVTAAVGGLPLPAPGVLAAAVVDQLLSGVVVVGPDDGALLVNPVARGMALLDGDGRLAVRRLRELVAQVRTTGTGAEAQLDLPPRVQPPFRRPRPDQRPQPVRVRVLPFTDGCTALVLEDLTEVRQVEAVRRDFVANVSHELKTPVGALHLLSEALAEASEDPVAVRRFAARMMHESGRLGRLVQEIIDLSRLQGADPMPRPTVVPLQSVVAEALDRTRLAAATKEIGMVVRGDLGLSVLGDERQLVTAVANLLDNAVSYSPVRTQVVVGLRTRPTERPATAEEVEISVADEGIGIPERDLQRVFERFYRADPARSRDTGGTGLGLAIVKHVASNHGGEVSVWSREGSGSTFTLRLPAGPPVPGGGFPSDGRAQPVASLPTASLPTASLPTASLPTAAPVPVAVPLRTPAPAQEEHRR